MRAESLKVSIVTPSFNQAAFIEEALWSVKSQSYPFTEHIVVDGGSIDGTVDILKRYSSKPEWSHLRWMSERDKGQSDALNKGFKKASGEIVGWLNSDDRYRSGAFNSVISGFRRNCKADVIYGDYTWIDEEGRITQVRKEVSFNRFVLKYHKTLCIPSTATFFRRRIFEEENFINENLHYAMDYEFFVRLSEKGYGFKHIAAPLADFRWHSQSKTVLAANHQTSEVDQVVMNNSRLLSHFKNRQVRRFALRGLRASAAFRRYSEKFIRGCYIGQVYPSLIKRWIP